MPPTGALPAALPAGYVELMKRCWGQECARVFHLSQQRRARYACIGHLRRRTLATTFFGADDCLVSPASSSPPPPSVLLIDAPLLQACDAANFRGGAGGAGAAAAVKSVGGNHQSIHQRGKNHQSTINHLSIISVPADIR